MKSSGPVHFNGSYYDLVFYYLNGQPVVRRKGSNQSKLVKKDERFARFRRQSVEFAQVQRMGMQIRRMLVPAKSKLRDVPGDNQLNRLLGGIKDQGEERENRVRDFDFTRYGILLKDFEFHSVWKVGDLLAYPPKVSCNDRRNVVKLEIPVFDGRQHVNAPDEAKYARILINVGVLSNLRYTEDGYRADVTRQQYLCARSSSGLISLDEKGQEVELITSLPDEIIPGKEEILLAAVGVEFLTEEQKKIETHGGLKVVGVF